MINTLLCPACGKPGKSKAGVLLHFEQALNGWDAVKYSGMPHSKWATKHGVEVYEGGYSFDRETLKKVLHEYFDSLNK